MNQKKITEVPVTILLFFVLLLVPSFNLSGKKMKTNLYMSSGVCFPSYPANLSNTYKPALNLGLGMGMMVSKCVILRLNFNFYSYSFKDKYVKLIWIGGELIELPGDGLYQGDGYYSVYDLWLDLKYLPKVSGGFDIYISGGGGLCYIRDGSYFHQGLDRRTVFASKSLQPLVIVGLGIKLKIVKSIKIFAEINYRFNFFKDRNRNMGTMPLRIGISSML